MATKIRYSRVLLVALIAAAVYSTRQVPEELSPVEPLPMQALGTVDIDVPDYQLEALRSLLTTRKVEVAGWSIVLAQDFEVRVSGTKLVLIGSAIQVSGRVLKVPIKTTVTAVEYVPGKDAVLIKLGTSLVDIRLE